VTARYSTLAAHFFGRFFDNEIVSQESDMRTNMVQALGLVAVPGMFVRSTCCPGAALQPAVRVRLDAGFRLLLLRAVLHGVMGFVMVLEWDALFPDRKDYLVFTRCRWRGPDLRGQVYGARNLPGGVRRWREFPRRAARASGFGWRGEPDFGDLAAVLGARRGGRLGGPLRGAGVRVGAGAAHQRPDRARVPPDRAVGADGLHVPADHGAVPDAAGVHGHAPGLRGRRYRCAAVVPAFWFLALYMDLLPASRRRDVSRRGGHGAARAGLRGAGLHRALPRRLPAARAAGDGEPGDGGRGPGR